MPKKKTQQTPEPVIPSLPQEEVEAVLEMKQPDGSIYKWTPSQEMDQKIVVTFDPSIPQAKYTEEEILHMREYVEKGICQCSWNGNAPFQNEIQQAIFGLWFADKTEDGRKMQVLGEDRVRSITEKKIFFENQEELQQEMHKSPASEGFVEAASRIEVNSTGTSSVKVETEEKKEEENIMLNQQQAQAPQAPQKDEQGIFDTLKNNALPIGAGIAVGVAGKVAFDHFTKPDCSYGSAIGDIADGAGQVASMFFGE